jgi:hypothetical protein
MCASAIEKKKIFVANAHNYRSILFLDDLFEILKRVLLDNNCVGQIPCSSYSGTIGQIASAIATHFLADIVLLENTSTYSFALKKSQFDSLFPPSLQKECENFYNKWKIINEK